MCRTKPAFVDAQKLHPIRQPICVEMQMLLPCLYSMTTDSQNSPSGKRNKYFTVPSAWETSFFSMVCTAMNASSLREAISVFLLSKMERYKDEALIDIAYQICRWHHERYDGKGYPDGLVGDEIPISAQIVSLADVYDALISERAYKKGYSHEKAIAMILNGECGIFNPILIECLMEIEQKIKQKMQEIQ